MKIKVIKLSLIPIFFENKTIGIAKAKAGTSLTTKIENKRTLKQTQGLILQNK